MIFFFENGQLGNQIFQYVALRSRFKGTLVLVGFGALRSLFDNVDAFFYANDKNILRMVFSRLCQNIFIFIGKRLCLIGTIRERITNDNNYIDIKTGIIPWIYYCSSGFFQCEKFINPEISTCMFIKDSFLQEAKRTIATLQCGDRSKIFVHVRRGDYLRWPTLDYPAVLPAEWYKNRMDEMRLSQDRPLFLIFTDDIPYVEEVFGHMKDAWISRGNECHDFALMAQCDGGILSASTFAWWAAYFVRQRNPSSLFFAPEYWAGHKINKWHPMGIRTSWIRYL